MNPLPESPLLNPTSNHRKIVKRAKRANVRFVAVLEPSARAKWPTVRTSQPLPELAHSTCHPLDLSQKIHATREGLERVDDVRRPESTDRRLHGSAPRYAASWWTRAVLQWYSSDGTALRRQKVGIAAEIEEPHPSKLAMIQS